MLDGKRGLDLRGVKAYDHGNRGGHVSQPTKLFDGRGILGDVALLIANPFFAKILFRLLAKHSARLGE